MTATEQPVLDRLTVLSAGGEHGVAWAAGQRGEQSVQRGNELRKVRPAGGKETFRAALAIKEGENRYNVRNTSDFLKRFGAGKEDPAKMSPSERASYKAAEAVLQKNAKIALYLELRTLNAADQTAMLNDKDIKAAIGEKPSATLNLNNLRIAALNSIARDPSFISMFPEVEAHNPPLTAVQKVDFIEKTLMPAEDQRLAARLGTRMQEAYKDSLKFTNLATNDEREAYRRQGYEAKLTLEQKAKQISDYLDGKGLLDASGKRIPDTTIAKWIAQSPASPEGTLDVVVEKAMGITHQEYTDVKQYRTVVMPRLDTLTKKFEAAHKRGALRGTPFNLAGYLAGNPGNPDVVEYSRLDAQKTALEGVYGAGQAKANILTEFDNKAVGMIGDPSLQGLAKDAKDAQIKMDTMDIKMKGMPVITNEEEKAALNRLVEEEDLCGRLDGALAQSIADVLEERYDVMEERMGRLTVEQKANTEKDVQKKILELKKKMNENWIKYDPATHKRNVQKDNIKRDVIHLGFTYDKDMALKQLIARDTFGLNHSQCEKLNVIDGTDGAGTTLLNPEQMAQLNKVFEASGQDYRDKLFADMLAGRSVMDRGLNFGVGEVMPPWAKLGFKRSEWRQMLQQYEPEITKGIENNREASAAMRTLEAQGVKIDTNMKWILYVLAGILGGGAGLLAGPALANASVGIAKGIGAKFAAGSVAEGIGAVAGGVGGAVGVGKAVEHFSEN